MLVAGRPQQRCELWNAGRTVHGPPWPDGQAAPKDQFPLLDLTPQADWVLRPSLSAEGGAGHLPLNLSLSPRSLLKLKDRSHPWLIFTHPS